MEITVLSENISKQDSIASEHGLSLYIQADGQTILFDMGQGELFAKNAALLGCDLAQVDFAVVSHGHYDHGGGIATFLQQNDHAPIYVSRHAFGAFYHGADRYIGLDNTLRQNRRLRLITDKLILNEMASLHSCNLLSCPYGAADFGLSEKTNNAFLPDRFFHEHYLLLKENGKRILFSGCSHKGVLNILSWFQPDIFVGGFHLSSLTDEDKLKDIAKKLASYKSTTFYTCHCTGYTQYERIKQYLPSLHYLSCGMKIAL